MLHFNPMQPPEDGLPPKEVHFLNLRVEPWPEGRRVRVSMKITPFLERPNIHVMIADASQNEVASTDIVENIDTELTFTMHLRGELINGIYTLTASLNYPEIGTVAQDSAIFETSEKPG